MKKKILKITLSVVLIFDSGCVYRSDIFSRSSRQCGDRLILFGRTN